MDGCILKRQCLLGSEIGRLPIEIASNPVTRSDEAMEVAVFTRDRPVCSQKLVCARRELEILAARLPFRIEVTGNGQSIGGQLMSSTHGIVRQTRHVIDERGHGERLTLHDQTRSMRHDLDRPTAAFLLSPPKRHYANGSWCASAVLRRWSNLLFSLTLGQAELDRRKMKGELNPRRHTWGRA